MKTYDAKSAAFPLVAADGTIGGRRYEYYNYSSEKGGNEDPSKYTGSGKHVQNQKFSPTSRSLSPSIGGGAQ